MSNPAVPSTNTATEKEARDVAEAARETEWENPSFVRELFLGRFRLDLIHPHPPNDTAEEARAKPFMDKLRAFMERVDSEEIDRTGEIPEPLVQELRDMGAFGIKIPKEYGGLGLSQMSYCRAIEMVTSKDGSLTALLSAHQSIGVPQPLKLFGTEEQKRKYFPRLAKGAISAFALTEVDAGSDPANMRTTATPTEDGKHFIINGQKLWITNGTRAELFVVMARTPDKVVNGKPKKQITAFIVEASTPGVEVVHRLRFMGLKALENGVISFNNVKIPRENILWEEGKGLKLALITLNTGRLTIPAGCAGAGKQMVGITRKWCNERVQWGQPIGKHEAVAQKLARMTAYTFAMESIAELSAALYERGNYDIRLEAAIAKLFNTEAGWRIIDDTLQIRGGRGYEMAESLARRGEPAIPIERAMRDFRINLIFEGSSEIMRLFIAREAVDYHFKLAFNIVNPETTFKEKLAALAKATPFYLTWYPSRWLNLGRLRRYGEFGKLARHVRYIEKTTRHLGRSIFHAMVRFGPKLERKQMVLFRAVDIGAELFAMSAACSRAQMLAKQGRKEAISLADAFCIEARERIRIHFDQLFGVDDNALYRLSQEVLRGEHAWLEQGIVSSVAQVERGKRRTSGGPGVPPAPAGSTSTTAKVGATQ
ncbi:MAG TPA: acyl-CoA dehydrogenase family protein [Gemmatimonadaceae bacterium]|nr:acyl-CoA dehydrogenase family protein [Gemmatimonadaceae bacterium]